jgi:hypothetical protein
MRKLPKPQMAKIHCGILRKIAIHTFRWALVFTFLYWDHFYDPARYNLFVIYNITSIIASYYIMNLLGVRLYHKIKEVELLRLTSWKRMLFFIRNTEVAAGLATIVVYLITSYLIFNPETDIRYFIDGRLMRIGLFAGVGAAIGYFGAMVKNKDKIIAEKDACRIAENEANEALLRSIVQRHQSEVIELGEEKKLLIEFMEKQGRAFKIVEYALNQDTSEKMIKED